MPRTESYSLSDQRRQKLTKRVKNALSQSDVFITFFKLKKIGVVHDLNLDEESTGKLYHFMKSFKASNVMFDTDFDEFMFNFLMDIKSESLELHLMCLGTLQNPNLDAIREKFSYSKIFNFFKSKIKNIFTEDIELGTLALLIKLFDNAQLVYKNLLPIIERLNIFLEKSMVDKSIIECCMAILCFGDGCLEVFNDAFVYSILSYLLEFLYKPNTFFIIDLKSAQIIYDTVTLLANILMKYQKYSINIKKLSSNSLSDCTKKLKEFKKSTVREEVMVVVSMTSCLTPLYNLYKHAGNTSAGIVDDDLLNFIVFEKNKPKGSTNAQAEGKFEINFERPFKSHYNTQNQAVRDLFLMKKYIFVDSFKNLDRIEFFNDLSKIENPQLIFSVLKKLKKQLDWSDLIVFACNAPKKERYISFLFDEEFVENKEHQVFLDIFINNIQNNGKILIYCTSCAISKNLMYLLPRLYLIDLDKDNEITKKKRIMIIEYLNSIGENIKYGEPEKNEITIKRMKEVKINIEKITLDNDTIEQNKTISINEIRPVEADVEIDKYAFFEVESVELNIQIQEFIQVFTENLTELHGNLVPLLIVIASKRIEKNNLEKLLKKLIQCLKKDAKDATSPAIISIITITSILCVIYKNEYYSSNPMETIVDLLIAKMSIKVCQFPTEYLTKVKEQGFDVLVYEPESVPLVSGISKMNKNSSYVQEYSRIMWLLTGKPWFLENIPKKKK